MAENYIPRFKPYERGGEVVDPSLWPEGMQRVALGVEYKGSDYRGFQVQPNGVRTVQQELEKALSRVANEPIHLICAGRTDAGVHATNQIVHFDTLSKRSAKAWVLGARSHLPETVVVRWACDVAPQFHARFSALSRTYRYLIADGGLTSAHLYDQVTWSPVALDLEAMKLGAAFLVGEHDFTSFRATQCQAKSPVRTIEYIHLARRGQLLVMEIRANAFLHHMVRNIVGVLMQVGGGGRSPQWVEQVLEARSRSAGGVTAKPYGLYLVGVDYPDEFQLPQLSPGPLYFAEELGAFGRG